jgi:hypothetical protein
MKVNGTELPEYVASTRNTVHQIESGESTFNTASQNQSVPST